MAGRDGNRQSVEGACSGARKRAGKLSHLQEGWGELWPGQTILKEKYKAPGHYAQGRSELPLQKVPPSLQRTQRHRSPSRPSGMFTEPHTTRPPAWASLRSQGALPSGELNPGHRAHRPRPGTAAGRVGTGGVSLLLGSPSPRERILFLWK